MTTDINYGILLLMKTTNKAYLYILATSMFLSGCSSQNPNTFNTSISIKQYEQHFQNLRVDLSLPPVTTDLMKNYFRYYGIEFPGVEHYYGCFPSGKQQITAHIFIPPGARKTIYFIHGYLLHSAAYSRLYKKLLDSDYAVAALDLPGHGFSGGAPADIDEFSTYHFTFDNFLEETLPYLPEPHAVIGMSMGCSVVIEYLLHHESSFQYHVLNAPLIRSDTWDLSKLGIALFGWAVKTVPTLPRDQSSNKELTYFTRNLDPLKIKKIPTSWIKALFRWYDKIAVTEKKLHVNMLVIQGEKDVGVDWRHNLPLLEKLVPGVEIYRLPEAKHELLLETDEITGEVTDRIVEYIKKNSPAL